MFTCALAVIAGRPEITHGGVNKVSTGVFTAADTAALRDQQVRHPI
eukprot:COSAG05_NODE_438_length_9828_cov_4.712201_1_plen_46_part_00